MRQRKGTRDRPPAVCCSEKRKTPLLAGSPLKSRKNRPRVPLPCFPLEEGGGKAFLWAFSSLLLENRGKKGGEKYLCPVRSFFFLQFVRGGESSLSGAKDVFGPTSLHWCLPPPPSGREGGHCSLKESVGFGAAQARTIASAPKKEGGSCRSGWRFSFRWCWLRQKAGPAKRWLSPGSLAMRQGDWGHEKLLVFFCFLTLFLCLGVGARKGLETGTVLAPVRPGRKEVPQGRVPEHVPLSGTAGPAFWERRESRTSGCFVLPAPPCPTPPPKGGRRTAQGRSGDDLYPPLSRPPWKKEEEGKNRPRNPRCAPWAHSTPRPSNRHYVGPPAAWKRSVRENQGGSGPSWISHAHEKGEEKGPPARSLLFESGDLPPAPPASI